MKRSCILYLAISGAFCCGDTFAQKDDIRLLDRKLETFSTPVMMAPGHAGTVRLPKRKYDSPLFCNELIPWKDGYIINSLSLSPGRATADHRYRFFYLNLINNKLETITTTLADSIESIIAWKNALYLSGKKNGESVIGKTDAGGVQVMSRLMLHDDGDRVGTRSWIKLAINNDQLLALQKTAVLLYEDGQWQTLIDRPFPAWMYASNNVFRLPYIPTENIRVWNNTLYFLQEVTQQRTAHLYSLDLTKRSEATEFFDRNGLKDNTKKEIISYAAGPNGLSVAVRRLMQDALLLTEKDHAVQALVINNQVVNKQGEKFPISPSCISHLAGDTMLLAGTDGLFMMVKDQITPLMYFIHTTQEIKEDGTSYDFEFVPRAVARIKPNLYLIGGLWGGLYLVDTGKESIQCLDDLKKTPPNRDLLHICQQ